YTHVFSHVGSFNYFCIVHQLAGMVGTVDVLAAQVSLQSISVTPSNPTLGVGGTQQFMAMGTFSDNSHQDITGAVTWSPSNTGVASITSSGLATAVSAGTSTITASMNGINGQGTLTVSSTSTPAPTPTFVSESRVTTGKGAHRKIVGFNLNF